MKLGRDASYHVYQPLMTSSVPGVCKTIDDVIICQTTAKITPIGSKRGVKYQGFIVRVNIKKQSNIA